MQNRVTKITLYVLTAIAFQCLVQSQNAAAQVPTGAIEGRVTLRGPATPISGAIVELLPADLRAPKESWREATSDRNGEFRFEELPVGTYYLLTDKEGLAGTISGTGMIWKLHELSFTPDPWLQGGAKAFVFDGETCRVALELAAPKTLRGRVVNEETNEPIPNATVGVCPFNKSETDQYLWRESDKDGAFVFKNLPPVKLRVGACKSGFEGNAKADQTFFDDRTRWRNYKGNQIVDISKDGETQEPILRLLPAGSLYGTLVDSNNKPVCGAKIKFGGEFSTVSEVDGTYCLKDLPILRDVMFHDNFTFSVDADGYALYEKEDVVLTTTEPMKIDVLLTRGGGISGIVFDEEMSPVPNAEIRYCPQPDWGNNDSEFAWLDGGPVARISDDYQSREYGYFSMYVPNLTSDAFGRFRFTNLNTGNYCLRIYADGYRPAIVTDVNVELNRDTQRSFHLTPSESIAGRVVGETGEPLSNVSVCLEEPRDVLNQASRDAFNRAALKNDRSSFLKYETNFSYAATTGSDGCFEFTTLNPMSYTLTATYGEGSRAQTQTVENVSPGRTDFEFQFAKLRENPDLHIRVVDAATGKSIPQFWIKANDRSYGWNEEWRDICQIGRTIQNASGEFEIRDCPDKSFTLAIRAPGYAVRTIGPFDPNVSQHNVLVPLRCEGRITARLNDPAWQECWNTFMCGLSESADASYKGVAARVYPSNLGLQAALTGDRLWIRNLPSGTYDVFLESPKGVACATGVRVEEGRVTDLGCLPAFYGEQKPRAFSYPFFVRKNDGTPLSKFSIGVWSDALNEERGHRLRTDERGFYASTFSRPFVTSQRVPLVLGDNPKTIFETTFPFDATAEIVYDPPTGSATLRGAAVKNGVPLEGVCIALFPKDGALENIVYAERTNEMGRYEIKNLLAGRYRMILAPSHADEPKAVFRRMEIELSDGENRFIETNFAGTTLSGVVVNRHDEPMSGAYVCLEATPELRLIRVVSYNGLKSSVRADAYGRFAFDGVQPGRYTLWSSRYSHGQSEKEEITIGEEDRENLRLVLDR